MKDAQLLTINNLYNLEIAQMMFKYENKQLPQAFNNFSTKKFLKMKTRSNSQIISNCFRTKVSQQSLKFVRPKLWTQNTFRDQAQPFKQQLQKKTHSTLDTFSKFLVKFMQIV